MQSVYWYVRAIASYIQGGVAKVYIPHVVSGGEGGGGSGGMLPQENLVKLDARRSLLRPFLGYYM